MNKFHDYFTPELIKWFKENNLLFKIVKTKLDKGSLSVLFNEKYCLKIYDCLGHGFGVTINLAEKYNESLFENDRFNLTWAYKYFDILQTASFDSRSEGQYKNDLPKLVNDLKAIVPLLNGQNAWEWDKMIQWITFEANRLFGQKEK